MTEIEVGLSIGEVSERTGVSAHTLRFYEQQGLFPRPVRRDRSGHRVYTGYDVEWLAICAKFRSSGMPVTAVRRYAQLVGQGPGNEKDRLAVLREHQEHLSNQLKELTDCLDLISHKVEVYEAHLAKGSAAELWPGSTAARAPE